MNQETSELAKKWGWVTPPDSVAKDLELAVAVKGLMIGEAVPILTSGIISTLEKDRLLTDKPSGKKTLDWLCERRPELTDHKDRILAMHHGLQYFMAFPPNQVQPHPDMYREEVRRYCAAKSCILIQIQGAACVLCFSTWEDLIRYQQSGRAEKYKAIESIEGKIFAIASPQLIIETHNAISRNTSGSIESSALSNLWNAQQTKEIPALNRLAMLIDTAIFSGATDIDIDPQMESGSAIVRFRVNVDLVDYNGSPTVLNPGELQEITRFLSTRSGANPNNTRINEPLKGQIIYQSSVGETFLRCSFMPLDPGGMSCEYVSVDLRLLKREKQSIDLLHLGFQQKIVDVVARNISTSQGLIAVCGPVNSGKSTAVAGMLGLHNKIYGHKRKRMSLEDPVERVLDGVKQFSMRSNDDYARWFKDGVLRHDPNVIFLSEVRGEETARLAVRASTTGHLVLTTLHATNSLLALKTLSNMVPTSERIDLIEGTSLVIVQRLIPKICASCRSDPVVLEEWGKTRFLDYCARYNLSLNPPDFYFPKGGGCAKCYESGLSGVMPAQEVLELGRALKDNMIESGITNRIVSPHIMQSLHGDILAMVNRGEAPLDAFYI